MILKKKYSTVKNERSELSKSNKNHTHMKVEIYNEPEIDARWMELKVLDKNIIPRSYHVAVVHENIMYVQGGYNYDKGYLSDFYKMNLVGELNGFKWQRLQENQQNYPGKLKGHTCVCYKDQLVIFGGQKNDNQNNNLTFIYNIKKGNWIKIKPNIALPLLDSHGAFISENKMFVYGGYVSNKGLYNVNFYAFDLQLLTWQLFYAPSENQPHPSPRSSFSLTLYNKAAWLFGGTNGVFTINDMWRFRLDTKKWQHIQTTNPPEPRRNHSMIVYQEYFFLFGGIQDITKQKNDIHVFSLSENSWSKIQNTTNSIYECSPTLKKHISREKDTSDKKLPPLQKKLTLLYTPHQRSYSNEPKSSQDLMKKIVQETKQKKFIEKKKELLKQFISETQAEGNQRKLSPITQNLKKALQSLGNQEESKRTVQHEAIYDPSKRYLLGKKPCARDAQSVVFWNQNMVILGGDRHLMSFSDIYFFNVKKGLQSKLLYDKKI